MAGKDRKKQLARQRYERQMQRRAARRARTRKMRALVGAVVAVMVVVGGSAALAVTMSGDGSGNAKDTAAGATPSAPAVPTTASSCSYQTVKPPKAQAKNFEDVGKPSAKPDTTSTLRETIKTNRGDIVVDLDNKRAACTVNSVRYLAGKNFFDNTTCHRLVTQGIKVLQCGDPSATGSGGPTYSFADENLAGATYPKGTVAMANSGPGTNGSQFFIVYDDSQLPPNYTVFGHVSKGLDVVQKVAKAGSDNKNGTGDGQPKQKVVIEDLAVTEK